MLFYTLAFHAIAAEPRFDVADEISTSCVPTENVPDHIAAAQTNECIKEKMNQELDAFLSPMKANDPDQFKAWTTHQGDWDDMVKTICELQGKIQDAAGGNGTGTYHLNCYRQAHLDRAFFARAYKADDAKSVAELIRFTADHSLGAHIQAQIVAADHMAPKGTNLGHLLVNYEELKKLTNATALGTCNTWPGLQQTLGPNCTSLVSDYHWMKAAQLARAVEGNE
jgi:hypothetical protein